MTRLRENGNNVCIFFMKKKLSSYLVPIFFSAHTFFDFQYWVWTETGTFWHFGISMHLKITLSNTSWGKIVSSVLSFTWKNKLSFYLPPKLFLLPQNFFSTCLGFNNVSYLLDINIPEIKLEIYTPRALIYVLISVRLGIPTWERSPTWTLKSDSKSQVRL